MPPKVPVRGLRLDVDLKFEFQPSIGISAKRVEKFGMDIRSFREPLKRSIQKVLAPSFTENFAAQGRPDRWRPLAEDTLAIRKAQGSVSEAILVRTGLLARTIRQFNIWSINQTQAAITDLPDNVWYGKVQQAGYGQASGGTLKRLQKHGAAGAKGAAKIAIPARPFVLIQDPEDYDAIEKVFAEWLTERMVASKAFRLSGA